ncbi:hypothetical protein LCGC14_1552100 [marine sediment metagenome]|uniref:Uncharacterized protein n=1 Tax=marine sediment metagenome TaxID=412755 RepID=A0A0F9IQ16_9ZZZZ
MDIWVVVEVRTAVVVGSFTTWPRAMHAKEICERDGCPCFIYFTEVNSENVKLADSEEIVKDSEG